MTDAPKDADRLAAQLSAWSAGIANEIDFWSGWLDTRGGQWPDDYRARLSPSTATPDWIAAIAKGFDKPSVTLLDVGAGPLTCVGQCLDGVQLSVTATDVLAEAYQNLFFTRGLEPPITTVFAVSEDLSATFAPNSFDIVHCRNALDHCFDPIQSILEMLRVVDLGGYVLLDHHENEAEREGYTGFHQFNISLTHEKFYIWNKSHVYSVEDMIPIKIESGAYLADGNVRVAIKKLADFECFDSGRFRLRLNDYLCGIMKFMILSSRI